MTGLLSLNHRPTVRLVGCSLALTMVLAACGRSKLDTPAGTVTLVNRVKSRVQGLTCSTCPSAVEAAVRRRLNNVAIIIDQAGQTVDLAFEQTATPFSSASFRQALAEAKGEVVSMTIEACGTIEPVEGRSGLVSGSSRLLIEGSGNFATGAEICMTGALHDQERPPKLVLGGF